MKQKRIVLEQHSSKGHVHIEDREFRKAEEGDEIGSFKVTDVEEMECSHPKRDWNLSNKRSESPPTLTGKCTVCGDKKEINPEVNNG